QSLSCFNRNKLLSFFQQKHSRINGGMKITASIVPQINNDRIISLPTVQNIPELRSCALDKRGNLDDRSLRKLAFSNRFGHDIRTCDFNLFFSPTFREDDEIYHCSRFSPCHRGDSEKRFVVNNCPIHALELVPRGNTCFFRGAARIWHTNDFASAIS